MEAVRQVSLDIADHVHAHSPSVHYHAEYELYYLTSGSCRYFIGEKTYQLAAGDIVVIPPGKIHKVIYESTVHSRLLFYCPTSLIPPSVTDHLDHLIFFPHSSETGPRVESLFRKMRHAAKRADPFSQDELSCYAMELFLLMARHHSALAQPVSDCPFVEKALAHVHRSYHTPISLSETAKLCAVSPEHLSRTFRKETGFGFNEYIKIYRLKKAESILLSDASISVAHVAEQCGFNDSNYFSNAYKKMYGVSPSEVRKQTRKELQYV